MCSAVSYRSLIASFLLSLYVFITLPVNVWHHHHSSRSTASVKLVVEKERPHATGANEATCDICTHQYGSQDLPTIDLVSHTSSAINSFYPYFQTNYPASPVFYIDNKGPPVLFAS
ncbi:MAG TPA: hypothetical protein PKK69_11590 [Ferruginibacter sp.]|nr:hypothetical protein [Ferruginibacter sp.]